MSDPAPWLRQGHQGETFLVAVVTLCATAIMLVVALLLVPPPLPEKIVVPSPVDGCRLVTGGQSWAPKDSVSVLYFCPKLGE